MAGFVEAWGRGFELISEAFKEQGLEVPTLVEEQGGVRVIIKRELFTPKMSPMMSPKS